ncbi:hypothetical protein [Streptomyces erythrochromogenes]|uniref:hypothetical protein n=1 Tax=Streptomyces erythrochromogenes TaxID=285574 RepID=UPI0036C0F7FC
MRSSAASCRRPGHTWDDVQAAGVRVERRRFHAPGELGHGRGEDGAEPSEDAPAGGRGDHALSATRAPCAASRPPALCEPEIREAGITAAEATLELALAFHHAVQGDHDKVRAVIARLRDLARTGDYAYYADIAHFMADLPLTTSLANWLGGPDEARARLHQLVQTRRTPLHTQS